MYYKGNNNYQCFMYEPQCEKKSFVLVIQGAVHLNQYPYDIYKQSVKPRAQPVLRASTCKCVLSTC